MKAEKAYKQMVELEKPVIEGAIKSYRARGYYHKGFQAIVRYKTKNQSRSAK